MNLSKAEFEVECAKLFDAGGDCGRMIGNCVTDLLETFRKYKYSHSRLSSQLILDVFVSLAKQEPAMFIADNPDEWEDISELSGKVLWRSIICPSLFSEDGGKTWYPIENNIDGVVCEDVQASEVTI